MAIDPKDYEVETAEVLKVVDGLPLSAAKVVLRLAMENLECTCKFRFDGQVKEHFRV